MQAPVTWDARLWTERRSDELHASDGLVDAFFESIRFGVPTLSGMGETMLDISRSGNVTTGEQASNVIVGNSWKTISCSLSHCLCLG